MRLPLGFRSLESHLAGHLGIVYAKDPNNHISKDPRICISLEVEKKWPARLSIQVVNGKFINVTLKYDNAPIQCRFCLSLQHKILDCVTMKMQSVSGNAEQQEFIRKGQ